MAFSDVQATEFGYRKLPTHRNIQVTSRRTRYVRSAISLDQYRLAMSKDRRTDCLKSSVKHAHSAWFFHLLRTANIQPSIRLAVYHVLTLSWSNTVVASCRLMSTSQRIPPNVLILTLWTLISLSVLHSGLWYSVFRCFQVHYPASRLISQDQDRIGRI